MEPSFIYRKMDGSVYRKTKDWVIIYVFVISCCLVHNYVKSEKRSLVIIYNLLISFCLVHNYIKSEKGSYEDV